MDIVLLGGRSRTRSGGILETAELGASNSIWKTNISSDSSSSSRMMSSESKSDHSRIIDKISVRIDDLQYSDPSKSPRLDCLPSSPRHSPKSSPLGCVANTSHKNGVTRSSLSLHVDTSLLPSHSRNGISIPSPRGRIWMLDRILNLNGHNATNGLTKSCDVGNGSKDFMASDNKSSLYNGSIYNGRCRTRNETRYTSRRQSVDSCATLTPLSDELCDDINSQENSPSSSINCVDSLCRAATDNVENRSTSVWNHQAATKSTAHERLTQSSSLFSDDLKFPVASSASSCVFKQPSGFYLNSLSTISGKKPQAVVTPRAICRWANCGLEASDMLEHVKLVHIEGQVRAIKEGEEPNIVSGRRSCTSLNGLRYGPNFNTCSAAGAELRSGSSPNLFATATSANKSAADSCAKNIKTIATSLESCSKKPTISSVASATKSQDTSEKAVVSGKRKSGHSDGCKDDRKRSRVDEKDTDSENVLDKSVCGDDKCDVNEAVSISSDTDDDDNDSDDSDDDDEQTFVCLWEGCKVYNKPSTLKSWLERHVLIHIDGRIFPCIVAGCGARFSSQFLLTRHVNNHFTAGSMGGGGPGAPLAPGASAALAQPSRKGDALGKFAARRKRLKTCKPCTVKSEDFFDASTMLSIQHSLTSSAQTTCDIDSSTCLIFKSSVIGRRTEAGGKCYVLLHWTPENIISDSWIEETELGSHRRLQVPVSSLPYTAQSSLFFPMCQKNGHSSRKSTWRHLSNSKSLQSTLVVSSLDSEIKTETVTVDSDLAHKSDSKTMEVSMEENLKEDTFRDKPACVDFTETEESHMIKSSSKIYFPESQTNSLALKDICESSFKVRKVVVKDLKAELSIQSIDSNGCTTETNGKHKTGNR